MYGFKWWYCSWFETMCVGGGALYFPACLIWNKVNKYQVCFKSKVQSKCCLRMPSSGGKGEQNQTKEYKIFKAKKSGKSWARDESQWKKTNDLQKIEYDLRKRNIIEVQKQKKLTLIRWVRNQPILNSQKKKRKKSYFTELENKVKQSL